jgi:hypothetical protein
MKALHIRTDKKATEHNNLRYEGGSYPPYVPPKYAMHDYRELYKVSERASEGAREGRCNKHRRGDAP